VKDRRRPLLPALGRQAVLVAVALAIAVPLLIVVLTSVRTTPVLYANPLSLPQAFSLDGYERVLAGDQMPRYTANSVLVTGSTVALVLGLGSMAAYAITRMRGRMSTATFALFVAGMLVPVQVYMLPLFVIVDLLGLVDTLVAVVLSSVAQQLPIAVLVLTGFLRALPRDLFEAGFVDGGTEFQVYRRIAMPLVAPAMATVGIFSLVITWNDLLTPLLLVRGQSRRTLPLALLQFRGEFVTDYPALFAGVVLASLPMVVAYVLLQRRFVDGLTAGAVKG